MHHVPDDYGCEGIVVAEVEADPHAGVSAADDEDTLAAGRFAKLVPRDVRDEAGEVLGTLELRNDALSVLALGDDKLAEHDEEEVRVEGGQADAGFVDAGHHLDLSHVGFSEIIVDGLPAHAAVVVVIALVEYLLPERSTRDISEAVAADRENRRAVGLH